MITEKYKVSDDEFNQKIENAINQIKDREFIATNRKKFKFSEKELREDFEFEDISLKYYMYDQVFTDAKFMVFFDDKIIWVV